MGRGLGFGPKGSTPGPSWVGLWARGPGPKLGFAEAYLGLGLDKSHEIVPWDQSHPTYVRSHGSPMGPKWAGPTPWSHPMGVPRGTNGTVNNANICEPVTYINVE
jgi:hypothetical protein